MLEPLSGHIRRLPPPPFLQFLQAVSLWLFVSSVARILARVLLRYEHVFTLTGTPEELKIHTERRIYGLRISSRETRLLLKNLQEITLQKQGESLAAVGGLCALFFGTFVGFWLLSEGVFSGAGSLLFPGLLLVSLGLLLDYFWGSGRTLKAPPRTAQLLIRVKAEQGFLLAGLDPARALTVVEQLSSHLAASDLAPPPSSQETAPPDASSP